MNAVEAYAKRAGMGIYNAVSMAAFLPRNAFVRAATWADDIKVMCAGAQPLMILKGFCMSARF